MPAKMKGLMKGFRYISQMFENEKEPEMEIGFPTDVKHVAHIGWDGPSASAPSWMNEFQSQPQDLSGPLMSNGEPKLNSVNEDSAAKKSKEKQRRHRSSSGDSLISMESPKHHPSDAPKHKSRHHSSSGTATQSKDAPGIPKHSRRKKSKGSLGGGSTSSRSKGQSSLKDADSFSETGTESIAESETKSISAMEAFEEHNEYDDISRELRDL